MKLNQSFATVCLSVAILLGASPAGYCQQDRTGGEKPVQADPPREAPSSKPVDKPAANGDAAQDIGRILESKNLGEDATKNLKKLILEEQGLDLDKAKQTVFVAESAADGSGKLQLKYSPTGGFEKARIGKTTLMVPLTTIENIPAAFDDVNEREKLKKEIETLKAQLTASEASRAALTEQVGVLKKVIQDLSGK